MQFEILPPRTNSRAAPSSVVIYQSDSQVTGTNQQSPSGDVYCAPTKVEDPGNNSNIQVNSQFTAVGFRFRGYTPDVLNSGIISLEPDDNNPHDANAVKILVGDRHVAYVSRDDAKYIKQLITKLRNYEPACGAQCLLQVLDLYPQSATISIRSCAGIW